MTTAKKRPTIVINNIEQWRREFLPHQTNVERVGSLIAEGSHLGMFLAHRVTSAVINVKSAK